MLISVNRDVCFTWESSEFFLFNRPSLQRRMMDLKIHLRNQVQDFDILDKNKCVKNTYICILMISYKKGTIGNKFYLSTKTQDMYVLKVQKLFRRIQFPSSCLWSFFYRCIQERIVTSLTKIMCLYDRLQCFGLVIPQFENISLAWTVS